LLRLLLSGLVLATMSAGLQAASISAPASSSTGTFTLTWPAGYDLWLADANWRLASAPARSLTLSELPAGTYRFALVSCAWTYEWELGYLYSCARVAGSERAVAVTRGAAPVVDESTAQAGTSAYRSGVSERGAGWISVPLRTPDDVHRIGPALSIEYDSARGGDRPRHVVDDLLGYGWSLRGIPYIHRCRVGQPDDAGAGSLPVLTTGDVLCLDGEGLVLVSGRHWVANAEYRLETDPDVAVVLRSSTGVGLWFEVRYPDGTVGRFGDTATSQVRASGQLDYFSGNATANEAYVWGLRSLTGSIGGQLTVDYERFDGYGVLQPARMAYDGAEVLFSYGARDDLDPVRLGWQSQVRRISVLEGVAVRANGRLVREYRLASARDGAGRLRLERIQECGYDRTGSMASCLPPLRLTWTDLSVGAGHYPVAVAGLVDGLGARTEFGYRTVTAAAQPLSYGEAPFGALLPVAETAATDVAAVAEYRLSDGLTDTGMRRWGYAYKGTPRRSTRGRGYAGFAEMRVTNLRTGAAAYTQTRLDWPFAGVPAQQREFDAPFGSHTRELQRAEHAYEQKLHGNGARRALRARSTRWLFESGVQVGGVIEQTGYCYRVLNGDECPATGIEADFVSRRQTVTTTGTALTTQAFTPAFWGDVPVRTIAAAAERRRVTETTVYDNWAAPWVRSAAVRRTTTHVVPGQAARTVAERFTYLPGSRVLASELRFPGDPLLERGVTRGFEGAAPGQLTSETLHGVNAVSRTWRYGTSDPNDSQVTQVVNPLEQRSERILDDRFGQPAEFTDADGRTRTIEFDPFGRAVRESGSDGSEVETRYERCDQANCGAVIGAVPGIRVTVTSRSASLQTAPVRVSYLDVLGREVLQEIEAPEPAQGWRSRRIGYDDQGRVQYRSRPVVGGAAPVCTGPGVDCTWFTYDALGRLVREDRPDGGVTSTRFTASAGRVVIAKTDTVRTPGQSSASRTWRTVVDVLGQTTEANEAYGSNAGVASTYAYDAHGNLASVVVGGVRVATLQHDLAGNRTRIDDSSSGATEFVYNGLGELVRSTDARGQTTTYEYDALGRLARRVDPGGVVHEWTWDAANATGRLAGRGRPGYAEVYAYDAESGLLTGVETRINVSGVFADVRRREFGYDAAGRLATQRYPNGLTVAYDYSPSGYVSRVVGDGVVLHEWRALDPFGEPSEERFHGGELRTVRSHDAATGRVTRLRTGTAAAPAAVQDLEMVWRSDGALHRRIDHRNTSVSTDDFVDTFAYDAVGRLTRQSTTGGAARVLDYAYAPNGNLIGRSSNVAGDALARDLIYGDPARPYRLTGVTLAGAVTGIDYDANGNAVLYRVAQGASTWLRYDARNNVTRISVGQDESAFEARDEFWYDPDGSRFLSRETWTAGATTHARRVLQLGGDYEEVLMSGGADYDVVQRIQVTPVARLVRRRVAATGAWEVAHEYAHRDHLGSVDAITTGLGAVLQRLSFDPFGERRAVDHASDLEPAELDALLAAEDLRGARGFTGHEHRNRTGFVHMGGRVYDPRIGRFVSPDPMVQAPWMAQGHNRYAYVMNSPLSFVDPAGLCGTEAGQRQRNCRRFDEHIVVVGSRIRGSEYHGRYGRGTERTGTGSEVGQGRRFGVSVPDLRGQVADFLAGRRQESAGPETAGEGLEVVQVVGQDTSTDGSRSLLDQWLTEGLDNLREAGIESLFGSGCIGMILGGCGGLSLGTDSGAVHAVVMVGVVPGAGFSVGTEGTLFASEFQAASGYGTAVFATGGVVGIGGSLGLAQGTNGFSVTGAVGYGFGFGGGVGFYYAMPVGAIAR